MEQFLQRDNRERQPLGWQQRQELIPRFEADLELLERVLGADFSDWRTPRDRSGGMVGARPEGQSQAKNGRPVQPGGDQASGAPGNGAQEPSENGAQEPSENSAQEPSENSAQEPRAAASPRQ
jgi:hypothetical protein